MGITEYVTKGFIGVMFPYSLLTTRKLIVLTVSFVKTCSDFMIRRGSYGMTPFTGQVEVGARGDHISTWHWLMPYLYPQLFKLWSIFLTTNANA